MGDLSNLRGAIWTKKSKDGVVFLSIKLEPQGRDGESINLVAFKNKEKSSDKAPDFYIKLSEPPKKKVDDDPFA